MISLDRIHSLAQRHGLVARGGFNTVAADQVPDIDSQTKTASLILFGNAGSSIWSEFSDSTEYNDGLPDPLNRWSKRIGTTMAQQLSGLPLFPFGGPPYQPFLQWARKSEGLKPSRIGMLIHPEYGLWHAYRFAIALSDPCCGFDREFSDRDICAQCREQPCLENCPVNAFTVSGYDVEACVGYLAQHRQSACMESGCGARKSCPEGAPFSYRKEQARFHMNAFLQSQTDPFDDP